jgi:uncharacterized protein (DUF1697 family)
MGDTYVALLRGINVGGKNKLPMKELVALFEDIGCDEVRTYIQSGNVVFRTGVDRVSEVQDAVCEAIAARFGYRIPVLLRTAQELGNVVATNPFLVESPDPKHLHVGFLADTPSAERVQSLDPRRSDVDRFAVLGAEVYLHVPGGMGRTKLTTDYFDRRLGKVMTVRNWRSVQALLEMAGGHP